jgi:acetylxylan esterase
MSTAMRPSHTMPAEIPSLSRTWHATLYPPTMRMQAACSQSVRFSAKLGLTLLTTLIIGTSSGAMMCEVLAGTYPDIFAGVAGFAGVPFGCFAGSDMWNSACATGTVSKTGAQWGDLVRAAYPGYTGARPKLQLWHGTADTTLSYNSLGESVKEWTNVLGLSETPTSTQDNSPLSGWTRRIYGSGQLQAITAQGVTHNIPVQASDVLAFFGLNGGGTGTTPSTTTTTLPATSTTPAGGTVPHYGQCGGTGYTGGNVSIENPLDHELIGCDSNYLCLRDYLCQVE